MSLRQPARISSRRPAYRADAQHAPDMVQDDRRVGKRARQLDRVRKLRMVLPGFEAQSQLRKLREARAERRIAHRVRRHGARYETRDRRIVIARYAIADAAESAAADRQLRLQHVPHPRPQHEVGMADDRLGDAARSVSAGGAHRRDAVDEFDFAYRCHLTRAVLAVHRLAFQEHGRNDVVAATDILQQLRQEIAAAMRCIPEMMVRIDDRQRRLQRRLTRAFRQPRPQIGVVAVDQAAVLARGIAWLNHLPPPSSCPWHRPLGIVPWALPAGVVRGQPRHRRRGKTRRALYRSRAAAL